MAKIGKLKLDTHDDRYIFFCPGCKHGHQFRTPPWTFNGDLERPTVGGSILTGFGENWSEGRCHSYVKDGMIQFLDDCHHELKGKTVPLPDLFD